MYINLIGLFYIMKEETCLVKPTQFVFKYSLISYPRREERSLNFMFEWVKCTLILNLLELFRFFKNRKVYLSVCLNFEAYKIDFIIEIKSFVITNYAITLWIMIHWASIFTHKVPKWENTYNYYCNYLWQRRTIFIFSFSLSEIVSIN